VVFVALPIGWKICNDDLCNAKGLERYIMHRTI
jgi:hypothetical protein